MSGNSALRMLSEGKYIGGDCKSDRDKKRALCRGYGCGEE